MENQNQIANNKSVLESILLKFNKFYISSLKKEVEQDEVLQYIKKARDKKIQDLQIAYNLYVMDNSKVSVLNLIKNEFI